MTHMPGVPVQGELVDEPKLTDRLCGKCKKPMTHQTWESSCGGYEDSKYTCPDGHTEWVDGIDS